MPILTPELMDLTQARDAELDAWLAHCSPEQVNLTARWLLDGSGADQIPKPVKAAQERLMEELELLSPDLMPEGA